MLRLKLLQRGRSTSAPPAPERAFPPPVPEQPLAVIGDVHGMAEPFVRLLDRLAQEAPGARVICVGDLIDRGEHSAEVLAAVREREIEVILGNHEEMLLRFLEAPKREGARWLRNGGLQTLASFGIGGVTASAAPERMVTARDALRAALGLEGETWLRGLPRLIVSGNVAVSHAGADPWRPISQQVPAALSWGHADFGQRARTDGLWVVHGHVVVPAPRVENGVISIDTGAYAGGPLSAALIAGGETRFLGVPGR